MSAQEGHPHPTAHSRHEAEIARLEHVLISYGTLTQERLCELSGAESWREGSFHGALHDAVVAGRIRQLTDELYSSPDASL